MRHEIEAGCHLTAGRAAEAGLVRLRQLTQLAAGSAAELRVIPTKLASMFVRSPSPRSADYHIKQRNLHLTSCQPGVPVI